MAVIYIICSKIHDDRIYLGSTINFNKRKTTHLCELKNNYHHSIKLQRHINKYGINDIYFEIIKDNVCIERLIETEQYCIDNLKPYFNTSTFVSDTVNRKTNHSAWNKGLCNLPKQSKEHIEARISAATKSKLKPIIQYSLKGDIIKVWSSTKEAGVSLGINPLTIGHAVRGTNKTAGKFIWKFLI